MYRLEVYKGDMYLCKTQNTIVLTPYLENLRSDYIVLEKNNFEIKASAYSVYGAELPFIQKERLINWIFKIINLQLKVSTLGQINYCFKDMDEVLKPPSSSEKGSGMKQYGISNIFKIEILINGKKIIPIMYKI